MQVVVGTPDDTSPLDVGGQLLFIVMFRRSCYSIVRATVWRMQVLQESENQPLPENKVSVTYSESLLFMCCLIVIAPTISNVP